MRKKSALIALVILALGLVGTVLSTLYMQNEFIGEATPAGAVGTFKVFYGFPISWYGYSVTDTIGGFTTHFWGISLPKIYWFSVGSLLLDAAFWIAISSFACIAIIKSVNILHKARASKNLSVINV